MDPFTIFTIGYLTNLASALTGKMFSVLTRNLGESLKREDRRRAFEHCVEAGVAAALSRVGPSSKEEKEEVERVLQGFFVDEYTARELVGLLDGKPLNMAELQTSLKVAGCVPERLPGLNFQ